jgi:DNA polymerase III subunit alpha
MSAILRSFSHFSLLSALPKVKTLVKDAKKKGYTVLALTDEDTTAGLVELYAACKEEEIKPIFGVQLRIKRLGIDSSNSRFKTNNDFTKITLLAKNETGRIAINEITSVARVEYDDPKPYVPLEILKKYFQGSKVDLWLGLPGADSELVPYFLKESFSDLEKTLHNYAFHFGSKNIFCEFVNESNKTTKQHLEKLNIKLHQICQNLEILDIASPAPRYLDTEDAEAFRAVLGIRDASKLENIVLDRDFSLPELSTLQNQFHYLPEAVTNIKVIIDSIENTFQTKPVADTFPDFELPQNQQPNKALEWETLIGFLHLFDPKASTKTSLKEIFPYENLDDLREFIVKMQINSSRLHAYSKDHWQKFQPVDYLKRIDHELNIINTKGYPTYFLVVADFMQYARDNEIVVNTRGSGAGSLVAFLTGITIIDPLLYTIPFERFLNPLRPSAPDIDCDIADDRRDEIIRYVTNKYGAEKVCQIITFGTMLPRMVIRDVGRTLGVSYRKCDRLAKLIPLGKQGKKMSFAQALEQSQEFANAVAQDEDAQKIVNISQKLEGNYRHASVHAAGVIITPTKLTDYTSVQWDSDHKGIVCQLDMNSAEKVGMVKMDFLGIRNLSTLGNTIELVNKRSQTKIDLTNLKLNSKKAFDLLAKGRTMGIFQLSGGGVTRFLIDLVPSQVRDLMAMVALYRPGPMANIPEYIRRKHDPKLIKYYVPEMEKWMESSYGILVYQDDLLYTVIELAGYDWAEVDTFRKGVGKKIQSVMDSQHKRFIEGCQKHSGLSVEVAEYLWSLFVPFAAYGFNKAHAASYGMVSYWTAYMKGEYTVEFMCVLMTEESNNLDKIAAAIKECKELGIAVLAPDINTSLDSFSIQDDQSIRYGLNSIKNLGVDVISFLIKIRQKYVLFKTLNQFLEAVSEFGNFNRRSLEALIWSGCLDDLGIQAIQNLGLFQQSKYITYENLEYRYILCRSFLGHNVDQIMETISALKHHTQTDSTGLFQTEATTQQLVNWNFTFPILPQTEVLLREKELLGVYITGNPLELFEPVQNISRKIISDKDLHIAILNKVRKIFTKNNKLMFSLQVTTPEENYEAVIFPKHALELSSKLEEGKTYWIKGKISLPKKKDKVELQTDVAQEKESSEFQEEGTNTEIVEYEEVPKILVDSLTPFESGFAELYKDIKGKTQYLEQIDQVNWSGIWSFPSTFKAEEFSNLKTKRTNKPQILTKSEQNLAIFDEYVILEFPINTGLDSLKTIKSIMRDVPEKADIAIKLKIEVSVGDWRLSKKIFYISSEILEQLGLKPSSLDTNSFKINQ